MDVAAGGGEDVMRDRPVSKLARPGSGGRFPANVPL